MTDSTIHRIATDHAQEGHLFTEAAHKFLTRQIDDLKARWPAYARTAQTLKAAPDTAPAWREIVEMTPPLQPIESDWKPWQFVVDAVVRVGVAINQDKAEDRRNALADLNALNRDIATQARALAQLARTRQQRADRLGASTPDGCDDLANLLTKAANMADSHWPPTLTRSWRDTTAMPDLLDAWAEANEADSLLLSATDTAMTASNKRTMHDIVRALDAAMDERRGLFVQPVRLSNRCMAHLCMALGATDTETDLETTINRIRSKRARFKP